MKNHLTYGQQREKVAALDTSCTFDFDVFDTGLFRIEAYKGSDLISVSNTIEFTSQVILAKEKEGRQNYWAEIPLADGIVDDYESLLELHLNGFNSSDMEKMLKMETAGNTLELTITGLESDSSYDGYIKFGDCSSALDIDTLSFAGTYIYECNTIPTDQADDYVARFAVRVIRSSDVNPDSPYHYYFYVSEEDPNCADGDEKFILCPLKDTTYSAYTLSQAAYNWNNSKWNKTGIAVDSWSISSEKHSNDIYNTDVSSLSGLVITTTSFSLIEDSISGNCRLVFYNKITGGMLGTSMNSALRTNYLEKDNSNSDAKYTFSLDQFTPEAN